jgi:hypothetical protein
MKNPQLKFRYAKGLGDLIACFLHSKPIKWLTVLITGLEEPCSSCSARISSLNILVPIKFWRLFFKDYEAYIKSLSDEYTAHGYNVNVNENNTSFNASKLINENTQQLIVPGAQPQPMTIEELTKGVEVQVSSAALDGKLSDYVLLSSSENEVGDILVRTQIFKIK